MDGNPIPQPVQPPRLPRVFPKLPITLLIVGVVAVGGYFASAKFLNLWPFEVEMSAPVSTFTPRPSTAVKIEDASTWKVYQNQKWGYEVKYPSDWYTRTQSTTSLDRITLRNVQQPSQLSDESLQNELAFEITTKVNANPKNLDLESWYAEFSKAGFPTEPLSKTSITVAGKSAIRIEVSEIGRRYHFYVLSGKDVIEIAYPTSQPKFQEIYQNILSTFKFVEGIDTSTWKTCSNAQYGFEFKYPPNYEVKEWAEFIQISTIDGLENPEIQFRKHNTFLNSAVSTFKSNLGGKEFGEELIYDKEIRFNDNTARELEYTSAMGGINPRSIFIQRNNFTLQITFTPFEEHIQILSTFKFK